MPETFDESVMGIERLLRRVAFMVKRRGRDILEDYGITNPQFDALLALKDDHDLTMGELCEKLLLACSTATDLVNRMEKNGFLARNRDRQDRRVIRLVISEKGRQVMTEVLAARRRYMASILKRFSAEEQNQLAQSLERLHSLMFIEKVNP